MDGLLKLRLRDPPPAPPLGQPRSQPSLCFAPNWPPQSVSSPPHWHTAATFRRPPFGWRDLRKSPWRRSDVGSGERRPFMAIVGFLSDLDVGFYPPIANPASDKDSKIEGRSQARRFITPSSPSYMEITPAPSSVSSPPPPPLSDAVGRERRSSSKRMFREALFYIGSHLSVKARRGPSDPRQNTSALKFSQAIGATLKRPATHKPQFQVEGQEALFKQPFKVDTILYLFQIFFFSLFSFFSFFPLSSVAQLIVPNVL